MEFSDEKGHPTSKQVAPSQQTKTIPFLLESKPRNRLQSTTTWLNLQELCSFNPGHHLKASGAAYPKRDHLYIWGRCLGLPNPKLLFVPGSSPSFWLPRRIKECPPPAQEEKKVLNIEHVSGCSRYGPRGTPPWPSYLASQRFLLAFAGATSASSGHQPWCNLWTFQNMPSVHLFISHIFKEIQISATSIAPNSRRFEALRTFQSVPLQSKSRSWHISSFSFGGLVGAPPNALGGIAAFSKLLFFCRFCMLFSY